MEVVVSWFYINKNIPCRVLNSNIFPKRWEAISFEFSLKNRNWLCIGLYKPPNENKSMFLDNVSKYLTNLGVCYDNRLDTSVVILLGGFSLPVGNRNLDSFMNVFSLEKLMKTSTCFKSNNPSCIDFTLTNKNEFFKKCCTVEGGISDHHHLVASILKSEFIKGNPKTKFYRDYKKFEFEKFKTDLYSR